MVDKSIESIEFWNKDKDNQKSESKLYGWAWVMRVEVKLKAFC